MYWRPFVLTANILRSFRRNDQSSNHEHVFLEKLTYAKTIDWTTRGIAFEWKTLFERVRPWPCTWGLSSLGAFAGVEGFIRGRKTRWSNIVKLNIRILVWADVVQIRSEEREQQTEWTDLQSRGTNQQESKIGIHVKDQLTNSQDCTEPDECCLIVKSESSVNTVEPPYVNLSLTYIFDFIWTSQSSITAR